MASRSIKAEEAQHLKELGLGDLTTDGNEHVIALDGVAVIVHPNNPVSQLDSQALHDIFTGKVSDWSELGGTPGKIQVLARDDDSGTYETFRATILGDDRLVEGAKRYMLSDALADAVAGIPGAIGFVGLPYVRTAKALAIGAPGAPPLLPTRFTVTTESYLLSRRLYLYTTDKPRSTWTTELLNFAQSARGQEAISKAKFVNLALFAEHHACSLEECTASYAATTANAARVSMDFHFTNHSSAPDSRARRDLDRLVEFLRDYRAVRLLLLGFSDNIGGPNSNIRLSRERAEVIAAQLRMRGLHPAVVTGFGDAMPLASNDTEQGRMRNRRVEVWVETDDAR
jgi:phosphate transport system substrate-binding protein